MIKLENFEVMGWEHVVRGMRNPMNSWDKSDSGYGCGNDNENFCDNCSSSFHCTSRERTYNVGPNDHKLMMNLRNAGTDHRKFMRMITVYVDITAPLYWWKEFDTYKVGTVANSCSTMHKIHDKEFTMEDFSTEHLLNPLSPGDERYVPYVDVSFDTDGTITFSPTGILECRVIPMLNECRHRYLETKDKKYWWQMIQLLPTSYNQKRTVMLNYEVLANMYKSRKNHKLDEWHDLCAWIESLPYSELITGATLTDIPICKEIMDEAEKRVKRRSGRYPWGMEPNTIDECVKYYTEHENVNVIVNNSISHGVRILLVYMTRNGVEGLRSLTYRIADENSPTNVRYAFEHAYDSLVNIERKNND